MLTATAPSPPAKLTDRRVPHAVVIGSGFGGLAAGGAAGRARLPGDGAREAGCAGRPGATSFARTASRSTPDPTIITAPFLFEELWHLAGRRFADDVELKPMSPFYRIRFHDGETFDAAATPRRCAPRWPVSRRPTSRVTNASCRSAEETYKLGFEQLGHLPFSSWNDMARVLPDMVRLESYRSIYGLVSQAREGRAPALRLELPSAVRRRQPLQRDLDLRSDLVPRAPLGRAFRDGRHGQPGARTGRPHRGAGQCRFAIGKKCGRSP